MRFSGLLWHIFAEAHFYQNQLRMKATKRILLSLFLAATLIFHAVTTFAQDVHFWANITFENNASLVKIDNSQLDNIWQIGTPSKVVFDSAASVPFAIVTDTLNAYPPKNISSFEIKILPPPNSCWGTGYLYFSHKYDTRPGLDGGFVEIRYDDSLTWKNIIFDDDPECGFYTSDYYAPTDTIVGGIAAFSGDSDGWRGCGVEWIWQMGVKSFEHDSLTIRFTFKSEAGETNHEGWMIDDIHLALLDCTGGILEGKQLNLPVNLSPNPLSAYSIIGFSQKPDKEYFISIFDSRGRLVREIPVIGETPATLNKNDFQPGLYLINISENGLFKYSGKFIVTP